MKCIIFSAQSRESKPDSSGKTVWYHNISGVKCRRNRDGGFDSFAYRGQADQVQACHKAGGGAPAFAPIFVDMDTNTVTWQGGAAVEIVELEVLGSVETVDVLAGGIVTPESSLV